MYMSENIREAALNYVVNIIFSVSVGLGDVTAS